MSLQHALSHHVFLKCVLFDYFTFIWLIIYVVFLHTSWPRSMLWVLICMCWSSSNVVTVISSLITKTCVISVSLGWYIVTEIHHNEFCWPQARVWTLLWEVHPFEGMTVLGPLAAICPVKMFRNCQVYSSRRAIWIVSLHWSASALYSCR